MRKRIEGIDLLRIISMLMIVMLHVLLHGGILDAVLTGDRELWFGVALGDRCVLRR